MVSSTALPADIRPQLGGADFIAPPRGRMAREELLAEVAEADALIAILRDRIDEELLDAAPRLKVVANVAVGYDNIDVDAASRRGVVVANTPDVLTEATADLAFALLLAAARRLGEGERLVRSGLWTGWEPGQLLGRDVAGRTLALVGLGRIGAAVARRARGFSMRVLYAARREAAEAGELGAERAPIADLLREADFLSLHCPLTPETRHLIGENELAAMKSTAILVNTARGPCVDEAALARALAQGEIGGAGLDVFEEEPRVHPDLLASERAVLAPHVGSATTTARRKMAETAARGAAEVLAGRMPTTAINDTAINGAAANPESERG